MALHLYNAIRFPYLPISTLKILASKSGVKQLKKNLLARAFFTWRVNMLFYEFLLAEHIQPLAGEDPVHKFVVVRTASTQCPEQAM